MKRMGRHLDRVMRGVIITAVVGTAIHWAILSGTESAAIAYIQRLSAIDQRAGIETQWDAAATGKFARWVQDIVWQSALLPSLTAGALAAISDDRRRVAAKRAGSLTPAEQSRLTRIAIATGQTPDQFLSEMEQSL